MSWSDITSSSTEIPSNWKAYDPYGPRGWLNEYCEWAVTRDQQGQILNINFICENPEHCYTLWKISPQKVANLYNELLGKGNSITVADFQLQDSSRDIINDPFTDESAYNPLNKWNTGIIANATGGGAEYFYCIISSTNKTLNKTSNPRRQLW